MPTTEESKERVLKPKDMPGRIDPDVVIPASVRAAAERAEAAHKAVYSNQEGSSDSSNQPPVAPASSPVGEGKPLAGAPIPPASLGAPAPSDLTPPAPVSAPPKPDKQEKQDDTNWEHRYTSMKGRHDKAQESIRQMSEQITNLQSVLATLNSQSTVTPQTPRELRPESLLTPQDVSDYGEEFLDVVGKKAREATSPYVQSLQKEIEDLKRQIGFVGGSIAQTSRERMFSVLDEQIPNWRAINQDHKFLEWLALPDAYSGAIRHNLLKAAWERNDTPRSLAFFRGFLAEEAAVDPAVGTPNGSQAPQSSGQQSQPGNGKVPLETYAAPGRAKSAAEIPAEKPLISRSEISKFYADCAAGRYRGNEAEKARLEGMIFAAQAEGRIIR